MSTVILASGNTELPSSPITLADGETANIVATLPATYNATDEMAYMEIQWQLADLNWQTIGRLTTNMANRTAKLQDAGVYRIYRPAQANAIGAERG